MTTNRKAREASGMSTELLETIGLTQEELAERVVDKISTDLLYGHEGQIGMNLENAVRKAIDAKVEAIAAEHILPQVSEYVENLTLEETNTWGEKTGKSTTFIEYLVERANLYMREKVNFDGKDKAESRGYSWTGTQTRIAHMVHKHLHHSIETAMKDALKTANSQIVGGIEDAVKIKLAEVQKQLKVKVNA